MKKLYIMVGPPGCGKSTYLKDKEHVVSRDIIRFSILKKTDDYFQHEQLVFNEFVKEIQNNLDTYLICYADATHLNEVSRNKLLNALNLKEVELYAVHFNTTLHECLRRNELRTGRARVPETVIRNMYKKCTNPRDDKHYTYTEVIEV